MTERRNPVTHHVLPALAVVAGLVVTPQLVPSAIARPELEPAAAPSTTGEVADVSATSTSGAPGTVVSPTTELAASLGPVPSPPSMPSPTAPPSSTPSSSTPSATAPPSTTEPPATSPPATTAAAAPPQAQVVAVQSVPAVRDLVVAIDGRTTSTDRRGMLELAPADFGATLEVVGVNAEPARSRVRFLRWSDGSTEPVRDLSTVPGPVVQLGVEVSYRIRVELAPGSDPVDSVVLESDFTDPVVVPVGEPTWVVAQFASPVDGALLPTTVEYRVRDSVADGAFGVRPESTWTVDVRA